MAVAATADWDRLDDGQYISIPIAYRDLDDVREWCKRNCESDFVIVLGPRVLFQSWDDAALATMWWRYDED